MAAAQATPSAATPRRALPILGADYRARRLLATAPMPMSPGKAPPSDAIIVTRFEFRAAMSARARLPFLRRFGRPYYSVLALLATKNISPILDISARCHFISAAADAAALM